MKIAIAQLNYIIGAFGENAKAIIKSIKDAREGGADIVVFSELSVCGYPPLDLLEHKSFIDNCNRAIETIAKETSGIAAIVGAPVLNKNSKGKNLFNAALFICNGEIKQICRKALLPTYDIFDEYRYFQPSEEFHIIRYKDKSIALTICEDLWYEQPILTDFGKNKLYTENPMDALSKQGCDLVINIAASPFAHNHDAVKSEILSFTAKKYNVPIIYVNQVGAHTELLFDGASRVLSNSGETIYRLPAFEESFALIDTEMSAAKSVNFQDSTEAYRIEMIHKALVMGIRDYFRKMNFKSAVLGLSGGIDSAVTLTLAVSALGKDNVRVLLMPSQYSSDHSVTDAIALADNLGVHYEIISIHEIFKQYLRDLSSSFVDLPEDIAEENIQARIRGTLLMAISNKFGNILLNTSNKSEVAVGYGTLYGDMNGGMSVLGDVYKTDVFRLAKFINRLNEIIPENTITKPPSAELRPDQKDSDSLPDYNLLDEILFSYIELKRSENEIITSGMDEALVKKTIQLVNRNEYKRFQTPPILRVSSKAFGIGRRMPLVARYS